MLTDERMNRIVSITNEKHSITVQELMQFLDASESTIRRDLNTLDAEGKIKRVFGGAVAIDVIFHSKDDTVLTRKQQNIEEKIKIAKYAASIIKPNDFVYLDAGTTTELIIDFITDKNITFVTNGFSLAKKLSQAGFLTYMPGGEVKYPTEAIVGEEAVESLNKYNFTIGFWGTNGIDLKNGFSTPDVKEALMKKASMSRTDKRYILTDSSKFSELSCVNFCSFNNAFVITTNLKDEKYKQCENITEV